MQFEGVDCDIMENGLSQNAVLPLGSTVAGSPDVLPYGDHPLGFQRRG